MPRKLVKALDFTTATATIVVVGKGQYAAGQWPHMVVKVAGSTVGSAYVTSSTWQQYSFSYGGATGSKQVQIVFDNDYYAPPADRNLLLDVVSVNCNQDPSPPGPGSCTAATALDLGPPGNDMTVATNACLRVKDGYPSWWGTQAMRLENTSPGTYPVPFTWSNTCMNSSDSGTFTGDWQAKVLSVTSVSCPTVISLAGSASGTLRLRYWAN
jgi:hypothetical protein